MLINRIKDNSTDVFHSRRGEIGWILDDNRGMIAIADAIECTVNREYVIFRKAVVAPPPQPAANPRGAGNPILPDRVS